MGPVNVVREDPKQPGLLFAGTEREVYFSIDDGDRWQSLRMNMPASSVRDLVIHEDDLVVGTHGRSIWILDNIAPLRELAGPRAPRQRFLFGPPVATRVRWNMFSDTPLPPDEPTGQNPPEGAILDYYLPATGARGHASRFSTAAATWSGASRATTQPERVEFGPRCIPDVLARPPQRRVDRAGPSSCSRGTCATRPRPARAASSRSPPSTGTRRRVPADPSCIPGATPFG